MVFLAAAVGLSGSAALARGPSVAPVGSACFCAQVCRTQGATYSVWTDPAGQRVALSGCPPADPGDISQSGGVCTCHNPLDWYRIWNELNPPRPPGPPYPGP